MKLGEKVLNILNKTYEPLKMVETRVSRYDLAFKTDESGRPIILFIGIKGEGGRIKGERFARRLIIDERGAVIKDHWDNKGKSSTFNG